MASTAIVRKGPRRYFTSQANPEEITFSQVVMPHTIIGTAGHIDHGKTLLVKALTGVDTDRAPEEKARGITIELGFAFFGDAATIIDVPGHERFVKTMVAGVSSIDLGLFVIAADDGVMPQSREHLDILELLGVRRGLVVLNKIDLADEEWIELVEEDIRELVRGSFLEGAEVVRVSALSGAGIDALRRRLETLVAETAEKRAEGPFRLPVDRTFQVKGFGMVGTGTVVSGSLGEGDGVELQPAGRRIRARGLQKHGRLVPAVRTGDRAAVNLPGLDQTDVKRGDMLASPGYFKPTHMLDARLHLLASSPGELGQRTRVRLHLGTREIMARVVLLEEEVLAPGAESLVQLRLEAPVVAVWGDRFVIRRYSPALTIGGGRILEPHPQKHRRLDPVLGRQLAALETNALEEAVEAKLRIAATKLKSCRELAGDLGQSMERVEALLQGLERNGRAVLMQVDNELCALHSEVWDGLSRQVEAGLHDFHRENPLKQGLRREEWRNRNARNLQPALFDHLLEALERAGRVAVDGAVVRAASHRIRLTAEEEALKEQIEKTLRTAGFAEMPGAGELAQQLQVDKSAMEDLLRALQSLGLVATLEGGLILHTETLEVMRAKLRRYLRQKEKITVAGFRDLIDGNRKYALALLGYFDREGFTERRGDVRVLRE